jgi:pimeloyl-ACP methyl ester carboxylesterase
VGRSRWLDVDWREHQRWVEVAGQPVNTIELGEGPPIVFVHGLAGSWPNWLEQLPVLAESHRVIAMDLPGFGHSPMPKQTIAISDYAMTLDGLMEALGVDAAALVGNSMGGFVSAELAIAHPHRVERLVLISAAGISTARYRACLPALRSLERILATCTVRVAADADIIARRPRLRRAALSTLTRHPTRLPAPLAAETLRGAGKAGFVEALEALSAYPLRERLPEIACPTLIVWGDCDRLVPARDADVFAEMIPGSRRVVFGDTGHLPMLERPAAFNALLEDFLSASASA